MRPRLRSTVWATGLSGRGEKGVLQSLLELLHVLGHARLIALDAQQVIRALLLDNNPSRLGQALRWQPENGRIHLYLADALARQGKRPEGLEELKKAIQVRPSLWEARYLLGVELAATNQIQEAQTQFEEVIRLRPDHVLARLNLGVALVRQRQFDRARRQFEEVLRLDPHNQQARQNLLDLEALPRSQP